jgi:post-segregation antitoxin (ccd killing protein)
MDVVISARVPVDALKILKDNNVNVSDVVRTSIISAAQAQKLSTSKKALENLASVLKKIPKEEFVKSIKEDREETH